MVTEKQKREVSKTISKYYDFQDLKEDGGALVYTIDGFESYVEETFSKLVDDLEKEGFVCFTSYGDLPNITVIERTAKENKRSLLKILLLVATIVSVFYIGLEYSYNYYGSSSLLLVLYRSVLYFTFPVVIIMATREFSKYLMLRMNGMKYSFPIFIPDPIGLGTMGLINSPTRAYKSKKAMVEASSLSLIAGFVISIIIIIIGNMPGVYMPPAVPAINSPVERLSSPVIFQLFFNRFLASKGILDPLAFAGWIGIVTTSFNAFPVGFLDGGVIFSSILGNKSTLLSYGSIAAIVLLGIIYPPWIILAIFVLLVGMRGPEPLNNISKLTNHGKALAAISIVILLLGMAPFPYHIVNNTFTAVIENPNSIIINGSHQNASFEVSIVNTGVSSIVPAFSISPSVQFSISGSSKPLEPGQNETYSITIPFWRENVTGTYHYQIIAYSGETSSQFQVNIYLFDLSEVISMNNINPYNTTIMVGQKDVIPLINNGVKNVTVTVDSFHNSFFRNYSMTISNVTLQVSSTHGSNNNPILTSGQGALITIEAGQPTSDWTIVAYDQNYTAAIANIRVVNDTTGTLKG